MIKKVNLDGVKGYSDIQQLPKGGYVCIIMGAVAKENRIGQYLEISCDIAEGEHKGFFADDYRAQTGEDKKWHCNHLLSVPNDDGSERDGWTKRAFKTFIDALEDSNPGYHFDWDETKLKGKIIGGLFNEREYMSRSGDIRTATNLASFTSADKIRSGKYRLPKDKRLKEQPGETAPGDIPAGYTPVSEADDLPF